MTKHTFSNFSLIFDPPSRPTPAAWMWIKRWRWVEWVTSAEWELSQRAPVSPYRIHPWQQASQLKETSWERVMEWQCWEGVPGSSSTEGKIFDFLSRVAVISFSFSRTWTSSSSFCRKSKFNLKFNLKVRNFSNYKRKRRLEVWKSMNFENPRKA